MKGLISIRKAVIAALFVAAFLFPLCGFAADYFVSINNPSASDSPPPYGTSPDMPWKTLHYAVSQLNDGDRLYVDPGLYSITNGEPDSPLVINHNDVQIWGSIGGGTTIDGSGTSTWTDGITVSSASGVSLGFLEVKSFYGNGISLESSTGAKVTDCIIYGQLMGSGIYVYNCDTTTTIDGNRIYDNMYGIWVYGDMHDCSPLIMNNLIYEVIGGAMSIGINVNATSTGGTAYPKIYHNTIDGGVDNGISVTKDVDTVRPQIWYNIITGFNYGIFHTADMTVSDLGYNDVYGNATADYSGITPGAGSISADPLFEDPAVANYNLLSGSPCINAVPTTAGDPVDHDVSGVARPAGSGWDMGAIEYVPVGSNFSPDSPCLLVPDDRAVIDTGAQAIIFRAGCYNDPEGDRHVMTRWMFARADTFLNDPEGNPDPQCMANNPNVWIVDAQRASELYELKLPVGDFAPGMAYVWLVGFIDAGSKQTSWSPGRMFILGNVVQDIPCASFSPGTQQSDYRMVSFTAVSPGLTAEEVFGDDIGGTYDTSLFRIGIYDPLIGGYMEYPNLGEVVPGRAYWVLARNGIDIDITGVPVTTLGSVEVALRYSDATGNGWNMIGPPSNGSVSWDNVGIVVYGNDCSMVFGPVPISTLATDNPYIDKRVWEWTGSGYDSTVTTLYPNRGYWVRARMPGVALLFPPPDSGGMGLTIGSLRRGIDKLKSFGKRLLSPPVAVAGSDDEPPLPMASINLTSDDGKSSFVMGCFISSLWE